METLYDRIIRQLNTLVSFLALSHEEVFDLIRDDREESSFTSEEKAAIPHSYQDYRCQVAHSAFLLGHSYFEAFLSDLAREILRRRPRMLRLEK
jgi:hypothetical protein